jgi:hypothetical protein
MPAIVSSPEIVINKSMINTSELFEKQRRDDTKIDHNFSSRKFCLDGDLSQTSNVYNTPLSVQETKK